MQKIAKNVSLKDFSNYKIGGPARYFAEVNSVDELKEILRQLTDKNDIFILGGGTNILFDDKGFDGLVILNKIKMLKLDGNNLIVGSGVTIEEILNFCIANGLSGLEWAGGLPGTIGGAVRGNAGAFGGEIKDNVFEVESLDIKNLEIKKRTRDQCSFSYRNSVYKNGEREFITSVSLKFLPGDKVEIAKLINEKINYRNNRHPLNFPNIGSIFKNVPFESLPSNLREEFKKYVKTDPFPVVPTAKIIFLSGLMGKRIGGAMISDKHTNFIVNVDKATSMDVLNLIEFAKNVVKNKFGIELEEEIIYLQSS